MAYSVKRKVDSLGRVVLPIEIRRTLDIECGDDLIITLDDDHILLETCAKTCIFCGANHDLYEIGRHCVCGRCRDELMAQDG